MCAPCQAIITYAARDVDCCADIRPSQGWDASRLYIDEAIVGKNKCDHRPLSLPSPPARSLLQSRSLAQHAHLAFRYIKGIRYHGRGRSGRMTHKSPPPPPSPPASHRSSLLHARRYCRFTVYIKQAPLQANADSPLAAPAVAAAPATTAPSRALPLLNTSAYKKHVRRQQLLAARSPQ